MPMESMVKCTAFMQARTNFHSRLSGKKKLINLLGQMPQVLKCRGKGRVIALRSRWLILMVH